MSEAVAGRSENETLAEAAAGHLRSPATAPEELEQIGGSTRPRRYRWLGAILVVVWLLPLLLGAIAAIRLLF